MKQPIKIDEGKNLLKVLSVIAEHQISDELNSPKQKDIVAKLPLTKGTVSNNCNELSDSGLISKNQEGRYRIDPENLLGFYREFLEPYFVRDTAEGAFKDEIERTNEMKTKVSEKFLFSVDSEGAKEKLQQSIPEKLLNKFKEEGYPLSKNAEVSRGMNEWRIRDEEGTYRIREESGKLKIYSGKIEEIFQELNDYLTKLILSLLADVREKKTSNLREVFHQTSHFILVYGHLLSDLDFSEIKSKKIANLISLSACLNVNYRHFENFAKLLSKDLDFDLLSKLSELGGPNSNLLKGIESMGVK